MDKRITKNGWDLTITGPRSMTYIQNHDSSGALQFVARFKTAGAVDFANFIVKHFTPQQYFSAMTVENKAPLEIAESKGYILPHIRRWAREGHQTAIDYMARRGVSV